MDEVIYRACLSGDHAEAIALSERTFEAAEGLEEGMVIADLVTALLNPEDGLMPFGFVAEAQEELIGAVLFSQMRFGDGGSAYLLAPMAVVPEWQGKGVGQRLIRTGLEILKGVGVNLVVTYGDPAFYSKTGFQPVETRQIPAPYPLQMPFGLQAQPLSEEPLPTLEGPAECVEAFQHPELW